MNRKEYNRRLYVRLYKSAWRRAKYRNDPEYREREKAYAREYYRKHSKMNDKMRPADIKRLEKVCNLYSKIIGLLNVVEGNIDPNDTYSMAVVRQMDVSAREDWHYLLGKVKWIKQEQNEKSQDKD